MDLKPLKLFACWVILHAFLSSADIFFYQNQYFISKFFQEYHQSVKQFGPKLFAKVITRRQNSPRVNNASNGRAIDILPETTLWTSMGSYLVGYKA